MNQSIGLVLLQIAGIVLGVVSVFWLAGSLPPEDYAIVGVYNVIVSFIMVFSNTGIETYAIRNVLAWEDKGEDNKIKLIITQAITFRMLIACIVILPLTGYAIYVSKQKFDGNYLGLFILMNVFSIARALNDSIILILKAFNNYFAAAFVTYSVNVFGRLLALALFFKFGFNAYILVLIFVPIISTIPVIFLLRKWLCFDGVFNMSSMLVVFKESRSFRLASYISYAFNFLDQLFVSIFMSAEFLGSFSVAKNLLLISKTFIENIFDPMIQGLVRFKCSILSLEAKLKKILRIRDVLLLISLIILPFMVIYIDNVLELLHLNNYPYLNYFAVLVYLSQIAHIAMKVKYNYIVLFYKASLYLRLTTINAFLSIFFFIFAISIDIKFVFSYTLITNLVMIFYTNRVFKNQKFA